MQPQPPPPGQGPVDPRGAFSPPPPPSGAGGPTMQQLPPMPPGPMPPMPGMYPPMMMPMPFPPPPKREKSFARAIFTTLATKIFGLSLVANIYMLFLSGLFGGDENAAIHTVHAGGDPNQKIAVIPIEGIITDQTSEVVGKWLQMAERDNAVKAVVLSVDSPGGGVTASDEIYHRVMELKKNRNIPIAVTMKTIAASG